MDTLRCSNHQKRMRERFRKLEDAVNTLQDENELLKLQVRMLHELLAQIVGKTKSMIDNNQIQKGSEVETAVQLFLRFLEDHPVESSPFIDR